MSLYTYQNNKNEKIVGTPNYSKNVEKLNYLYITGGTVKMVQSARKRVRGLLCATTI